VGQDISNHLPLLNSNDTLVANDFFGVNIHHLVKNILKRRIFYHKFPVEKNRQKSP
jgi:hypothetical protein